MERGVLRWFAVASETEARIIERLDEQERGEGELPRSLQLYRELLRIQAEASSQEVTTRPDLAEGEAQDRLHKGTPLLSFEEFSPDWDHVQRVFEQVVSWAVKDSEESPGEVESLRNIARDRSLFREVVGVWYRGDLVTEVAAAHGIDADLLSSAISVTLKPFLVAYARMLSAEVDRESWRRNYCPICGGKPDFAYLDRERGARWLLCSRCDAEWVFQRLQCPYCGTQDPDALAYYVGEDESQPYRLYVCERCRTYIKTIDLRRTDSEVLLPLERLVTLEMDRAAQEQGYKPG